MGFNKMNPTEVVFILKKKTTNSVCNKTQLNVIFQLFQAINIFSNLQKLRKKIQNKNRTQKNKSNYLHIESLLVLSFFLLLLVKLFNNTLH